MSIALTTAFIIASAVAVQLPRNDSQGAGEDLPEAELNEVMSKLETLGAAYFRGLHQRPDDGTVDWFRARARATIVVATTYAGRALDRRADAATVERFQWALHFVDIVDQESAYDLMERVFDAADVRLQLFDATYVKDRSGLKEVMLSADWEWAERLRGFRVLALESLRGSARADLTTDAIRLLEADEITVTAAIAYLNKHARTEPALRKALEDHYHNPASPAFRHPGLEWLPGVDDEDRNN